MRGDGSQSFAVERAQIEQDERGLQDEADGELGRRCDDEGGAAERQHALAEADGGYGEGARRGESIAGRPPADVGRGAGRPARPGHCEDARRGRQNSQRERPGDFIAHEDQPESDDLHRFRLHERRRDYEGALAHRGEHQRGRRDLGERSERDQPQGAGVRRRRRGLRECAGGGQERQRERQSEQKANECGSRCADRLGEVVLQGVAQGLTPGRSQCEGGPEPSGSGGHLPMKRFRWREFSISRGFLFRSRREAKPPFWTTPAACEANASNARSSVFGGAQRERNASQRRVMALSPRPAERPPR
jgi:hypothetical protein